MVRLYGFGGIAGQLYQLDAARLRSARRTHQPGRAGLFLLQFGCVLRNRRGGVVEQLV